MVVVAVGSLTDSCRVPVHMMIEDSFSITGGEHANFPTSFIEVNQEGKRERGREKRGLTKKSNNWSFLDPCRQNSPQPVTLTLIF